MNKLLSIVSGLTVVAATTVALAAPVNVSATGSHSDVCTVKAVGKKNTAGNADSRFKLNADGTVTAAFTVTGKDCKLPVTLASWEAPDAVRGLPYSEQKLFAHVTGTFATGTHTLTVKLPNCFYQVDLVRGSSPTDANGGPVYPVERMMGSLHGGTQKCGGEETPPETPETPVTPAEVMPATGIGSSAIIASVVSAVVGGLGFHFRVQRKNS